MSEDVLSSYLYRQLFVQVQVVSAPRKRRLTPCRMRRDGGNAPSLFRLGNKD